MSPKSISDSYFFIFKDEIINELRIDLKKIKISNNYICNIEIQVPYTYLILYYTYIFIYYYIY
jgi:hypothetical protein